VAVRDIIQTKFNCSYAPQPESIVEDLDGDIEMSRNHTENIFDNLPALSVLRIRDLHDELGRYLSTDPEHVKDVLM
jgi:hypothetical protein